MSLKLPDVAARPQKPAGDWEWGNPALAAGATGVALASSKAHDDTEVIRKKLEAWLSRTGKISELGEANPVQGMRSVDNYVRGGQDVLKSNILGMPIPHWMMQANVPVRGMAGEKGIGGPGAYVKALLGKITGDQNAQLPIANRVSHAHYKQFATGDTNDLRRYIQTKFLPREGLSPIALEIIDNQDLSAMQKLKQLRAHDPEARKLFYNHLSGLPEMLGGKAYGPNNVRGGITDVYRTSLLPKIYGMQRFAKTTGRLAVPAAAIAGVAGLWQNRDQMAGLAKQAEDSNSGFNPLHALAAASAAPLGLSGVKDIRSPLEIGLSYGMMPEIGDGHKTPAKAIEAMLSELRMRQGTPKFNVTHAIRDNIGWVDPELNKKNFSGMIDTGWGALTPPGWGHVASPYNRHAQAAAQDVPLRIGTGGLVGVQTDLGDLGMPGEAGRFSRHTGFSLKDSLARALGFSDRFLSYDPNPEKLRAEQPLLSKMKLEHMGRNGFPTMTPAAIKTLKDLQGVSREQLIREVLDSPGMVSDKNRNLLESMDGRQAYAITGSGRGDQVAYRALKQQKLFERLGVADKYRVIAMLGDSAKSNPLAQKVMAHPDIAAFGRLPQRHYIGLPGKSDWHNASSGTSATMESLGTDAHLIFHPRQAEVKQRELRALGRSKFNNPAQNGWGLRDVVPHRGYKNPDKVAELMHGIQRVDLDTWNYGNKKYALGMPGVSGANHPGQIMKILNDQSLMTDEAKAVRAARADFMIKATERSRLNTKDFLHKFLKERRAFANLKGAGKLTGAAGLLGLAGLPFMTKNEE